MSDTFPPTFAVDSTMPAVRFIAPFLSCDITPVLQQWALHISVCNTNSSPSLLSVSCCADGMFFSVVVLLIVFQLITHDLKEPPQLIAVHPQELERNYSLLRDSNSKMNLDSTLAVALNMVCLLHDYRQRFNQSKCELCLLQPYEYKRILYYQVCVV